MEKEVLSDKEISDYLDKYDISYWNTLIVKFIKLGINTIKNEDPNIYTIDEIDNLIKKTESNKKEEKNKIYQTLNNDNLSTNDINIQEENNNKPIKKKYEIGKTSYPIKSNYDYSYKPKYNSKRNYSFNIKNKPYMSYSYSNNNKKKYYPTSSNDLEIRANSPKYTYEDYKYKNYFSQRKPLNYLDDRNNYLIKLKNTRNPSLMLESSSLPCLNYDYNNYTFKDYNLNIDIDNCYNKSKNFLKNNSYFNHFNYINIY